MDAHISDILNVFKILVLRVLIHIQLPVVLAHNQLLAPVSRNTVRDFVEYGGRPHHPWYFYREGNGLGYIWYTQFNLTKLGCSCLHASAPNHM